MYMYMVLNTFKKHQIAQIIQVLHEIVAFGKA